MAMHSDVYSTQAGVPHGDYPADDMGHVLGRLTDQIQARIAEVEQRHAMAMRELQGKLERMSGAADKARPAMPVELATAFGRIEAGMADLVDRIAETAPDKRRGAEAFVFNTAKSDSSHFVFNPPKRVPIAPVLIGGAEASNGEPWDPASAAALAHLYESGEAILGRHLPEAALFAPAQWAKADTPQAATEPAIEPVVAPAARAFSRADTIAPLVHVAGLGDDRDWLDGRLSGIADHVSKSIAEARPDGALAILMSRVDQLETRFTSALDGIASKSDVAAMRKDALGQVEAQIKELASHIENTHQQLTRLDSIEQHLSDLTAFAHASMDAEVPAAAGEPMPDMQSNFAELADLAVERALARAPAPQALGNEQTHSGETQARVDAVHALLQDFAAERRRGDQYTTGMLETVQEALIRLIDRVDAIDAGAPQRSADVALRTPQPLASEEPHVVPGAVPEADEKRVFGTKSAASKAEPETAVRRAARVGARAPQDAAAAMSGVAEVPPEVAIDQQVPSQPEISIKDLRLNARNVKITTPSGKAEATGAASEPVSAAAKPSRVQPVTAQPAAAAAAGAGKRGLYVAVAALSMVGIGFMAQHLWNGGDALPAPAAGLTVAPIGPAGMAVPELKKSGANVAPEGQIPQLAAGTQPPGMMAPLPQAAMPTPGQSTLPPGQRSQLRPPTSAPETVNDDISLLDADDAVKFAAAAGTTQPKPRAPSGSAIVSAQPMQGLALALPMAGRATGDLSSANRQASQAAASERVGAMARPAGDFSQRFGQGISSSVSPAESVKVGAAAIVTGSNPPARDGSIASDGLADAVSESAELPPALVGPLSLRMAAAKGDASAAFEVATRLAEGRGIKQDFKQAIVWYQRAAAKGLAIAQYRLGTLYERGLGTQADATRARAWYKKAADQGNIKAMHNMAVLSAGNGQTAPDYASAAKWFKDAAERGLADSQFNLGVLYENGLGVAKDPRQAYVWFSLAARGGDAEALRRRDQLLATLDEATVKSGNEDVQKWHSRPTDVRVNDPRVAGDQWRAQAGNGDQTADAGRSVQTSAAVQPRTVRAAAPPR